MTHPSKIAVAELVAWYQSEYQRRSTAVSEGKGQIDWLDPGTRVSFSEVCAQAEALGMNMNPVELRLEFEKAARKVCP